MRRIFITGASTGIGEALARQYAGADTEIGLFARRRDLLEKLSASLPGRSAIYAADIADTAAVGAAAQDFLARFGAPDLVIANAGVSVVTICPGYIDTPMTQVNQCPMPFMISAQDAAKRFARAIAAKRRLAVIPWQMALVSLLLRALPGWLYDRLAARAPRKPRDLPL